MNPPNRPKRPSSSHKSRLLNVSWKPPHSESFDAELVFLPRIEENGRVYFAIAHPRPTWNCRTSNTTAFPDRPFELDPEEIG